MDVLFFNAPLNCRMYLPVSARIHESALIRRILASSNPCQNGAGSGILAKTCKDSSLLVLIRKIPCQTGAETTVFLAKMTRMYESLPKPALKEGLAGPADGRSQTAKICDDSRDHSERALTLTISAGIAKTPEYICTSTTPIRAESRARTARIAKNPAVFCTSPIPAESRARQRHARIAKEPGVFAHPPRRSGQRVARVTQNSKKFLRTTTPIPAEGRPRSARIAQKLQLLHIDHANPRKGSRVRVGNRHKSSVFAHRPRRSLRGSHFRRARLVPPRCLKILIKKACKFARARYARARRNARSLRISLCIYPIRASLHFTAYFPCACLKA